MFYSLYLHIPFCKHRCAYCDFNTYAGQESLIPTYVDALCREIASVAHSAPGRLTAHTIFFGGGTPSLLTPAQFEAILGAISRAFDLVDPEISIEANPGTCSFADLLALRSLGVNRISFGVQSFDPLELRQLERIHDPFDVYNAVAWARRAGFGNLNLDLIYGLPEQSPDRWSATVQRAVDLAPEHLSLYALTVEHGTPFGRWASRGLLPLPDPDAAAGMYERAGEMLEAHGYQQYEISNWARQASPSPSTVHGPPSFACRHNLQYWRNLPYLGFGAGAHGYASDMRVANILRIRSYIERCSSPSPITRHSFPLSPATVQRQQISLHAEMQETMITGLRLTQEGVSESAFADRFGVPLVDAFGKEIGDLIRLGLLEWSAADSFTESRISTDQRTGTDRCLRLTKSGRLLGNQAFLRFVD